MRAIPIDRFLETVELRRSEEPPETIPAADAAAWSRIVDEGRRARARADGGRWRIGQLASMVVRRYRSRALERFAAEIGETHATVRRLRWVATRYEPDARLRFARLSFSHFQAVAGRPDRLAWLARANREGWTVERLVRERRLAEARGGALRDTPRPDLERRLRPRLAAARRSLAELATLDARAIRACAEAWLPGELDEIERAVGQVRRRLRGAGAAGRRRATA